MNQCKICNMNILNDSQYINGNYYHNDCIEQLQQDSQRLKEQLERATKSTINSHKYASDMENKVIELESKLKQRDEVIDELKEFFKEFHNYESRFKWCEQDYVDTIEKAEEILQRYKGDSNE